MIDDDNCKLNRQEQISRFSPLLIATRHVRSLLNRAYSLCSKVCLKSDQAVFNGVACQLRYTVEVELAHKVGAMLLNGFDTQR